MFYLGGRLVAPTARNNVRKYSADVKPIKMAHNIFKGANTDATLPPLMILHGLFGSKQNWRSVSRALGEKTNRQIISLDARNHGDSPHTDLHGSRHMAADIVHLMQHMGIEKASLMGHSMGGRAVMHTALKYPQRVEGAIVVDISPIALPTDWTGMEQIFNAMKNVHVPKELSMAEGRKYAKIELKKTVGSPDTVEFVSLNLRKQSDGTFKWACNVDGLHRSLPESSEFMKYTSGLKPYKGPVMFVCGNLSNSVDPNSWPLIKEIFPNAEIHWLDAGHLVHYDQREKFLTLLVNFLKYKTNVEKDSLGNKEIFKYINLLNVLSMY